MILFLDGNDLGLIAAEGKVRGDEAVHAAIPRGSEPHVLVRYVVRHAYDRVFGLVELLVLATGNICHENLAILARCHDLKCVLRVLPYVPNTVRMEIVCDVQRLIL